MKTPIFILMMTVLVCVGCATALTQRGMQIQITQPAEVDDCRYLDDITRRSSIGGVYADEGIKSARNLVLNDAAQMGATHIVWSQIEGGYSGATASAKVYRCRR